MALPTGLYGPIFPFSYTCGPSGRRSTTPSLPTLPSMEHARIKYHILVHIIDTSITTSIHYLDQTRPRHIRMYRSRLLVMYAGCPIAQSCLRRPLWWRFRWSPCCTPCLRGRCWQYHHHLSGSGTLEVGQGFWWCQSFSSPATSVWPTLPRMQCNGSYRHRHLYGPSCVDHWCARASCSSLLYMFLVHVEIHARNIVLMRFPIMVVCMLTI